MLAKRLMGNAPPRQRRPSVYLNRLLFDRDTVRKPDAAQPPGEAR